LTIPEIDLPDLDPIASSAPCKYIVATPGRLADKRKFGPLRPAPRRFCGRLLRILGKQMIGRRRGSAAVPQAGVRRRDLRPILRRPYRGNADSLGRSPDLLKRVESRGVTSAFVAAPTPYWDQPRGRPRTSSRVRLAGHCAFRASGWASSRRTSVQPIERAW